MAADDADLAARVIERLLVDPAFRADFRRDPATACREAGLDDVAEVMAFGAGKSMQTLEIRESRSSLAGVMMAAAVEGVGVFGMMEHAIPGAMAAPGVVSDVLSRVNLPKVDPTFGLRGALASDPSGASGGAGVAGASNADAAGAPGVAPASSAPPGSPASGAAPGSSAAPASDAAPGSSAAPASDAAPGSSAAPASDAGAASGEAPGSSAGPASRAASASAADPHANDATAPASDPAPRSDGGEADPFRVAPHHAAASAEPQAAAPVPAPAASGAPLDPTQFGIAGKGGPPSAEALALLDNKNVVLDANGIADIKSGRMDPREVAVLTKLSEDHRITISCTSSDHPQHTAGGSISNHYYGRAMDIAAVDGRIVNADNDLAREIAGKLSDLDPKYRPDEIGSPWAINAPGYFTDAAHQDHLHVAFKTAIDPSWTPPADLAAGGASAPAGASAAVAAPGIAAPADASAAAATAAADGGTVAFAVPKQAVAAAGGTMSLAVPGASDDAAAGAAATAGTAPGAPGAPGAPAQPGAPATPAATAPSAGEHVLDGAIGQRLAGAKAVAALTEAMKYKGTPYLWGGSSPKTGFDCSGLMQWAYAKQGIEIPRVSEAQILAANAKPIDRQHLLPGDLVFFRDPGGDVHHVGMSMGGDRFLHAPHTGDVVKISSLDEPYYAQQFTGGRRFDATPLTSPEAAPAPADIGAAHAALERDAAAVKQHNSMIFKALVKQEASHQNSTVRFMPAVRPEDVVKPPSIVAVAADAALAAPIAGSLDYPGDNASKEQFAAWLAAHAQKAGLPPELPVMASLVESGLTNIQGGDADSVGFFQMRVGIWNKGAYAGYPQNPNLQAKWFIDGAVALKNARVAAGDANFGKDPSTWGNWIADVERPAAQYRGRYQLRLAQARGLLGGTV